MNEQQIKLNQQQVAKACMSARRLLNDDARVQISPSMAMSGDLVIIDSVLSALASGESVLITGEMAQEYGLLKKAVEATTDED